ncbi:MAG TPA: hypothetical protein VLH13_05135, partial [Methanomassiliicoccales archaeon]|nr:hypothetical protein [Methanomassiliicoccales archaeon]
MRRIAGIDTLRTIGVLMVLIAGLQPFLHLTVPTILIELMATMGAGIFIFASGMSLSQKYPRIDSGADLAGYFRHHVFHRFPIYWSFIIFTLVFTSVLVLDPYQTLAYLSGTQALLGPLPALDMLWLAGLAIILYAAYPLLIWKEDGQLKIIVRSVVLLVPFLALDLLAGSIYPMLFLFLPAFVSALVLSRCTDLDKIGNSSLTSGLIS